LALVLPGILKTRTGLTVTAAYWLVALTICAAIYQAMSNQPESVWLALGMGVLCGIVGYLRQNYAPLSEKKSARAGKLALAS
jgi:hypothetical protein